MTQAKMTSPFDMLETSCTRLVRRMVNLPRTISRGVDQGLDLMTIGGGRRNQSNFPPPIVPLHNHHLPSQQSLPNNLQSYWDFLSGFEQQFGHTHPFFYACSFIEVLKMAQDEHKLVFLYLHSPGHPFTPPFCTDTLCSEMAVQFLDTNFMSWGGVANRGEGLHLATTIQPTTFPFCVVVTRGSDDSLVILQKIEGLVTPDELVETLQTTLEEQGLIFYSGRAKDEENRREHEVSYSTSLQDDQEKLMKPGKKPQHWGNAIGNTNDTMILIRFPNGERKQRVFSHEDQVEAIFKFIDSLGLTGVDRNYRLVSSFPRKVYGVDQMRMSLKDAEFDAETTLFIELV